MAHSTRAANSQKPHQTSDKLTPRGDGRWCKKYKTGGQWEMAYFRGTEAEALAEWQRVKADLLAGRSVGEASDKPTVAKLCNKFLASKRTAVDVGKINARTFIGYSKTAAVVVEEFGRQRLIETLRPEDFARLYRRLAAKHGVSTIGREVTIVKSVFKFAVDADLIDKPVKFGPDFKAPGKKHRRAERNKAKREHGKRLFEAADVRRMIDAASPQLKAMILLGINGGLGNTDCASLHLSHLDLDAGWLDYPRPKTEIDRRVPLWPETIAAIRAALEPRRQPSDPDHAKLVFVTRLGQPWVRYELAETVGNDGKLKVTAKTDDAIAKATRKLLDALEIYRPGLSFYTLRHTFETIGGGCKDQVAVDCVMGHVDSTMAAEYREEIDDARLQAVVDHVHAWLFPPEEDKQDGAAEQLAAVRKKAKPRKAKAGGSNAAIRADVCGLRIVG